MRIERLALKNFKCFKEVDVSFSRITLLTGENSSGKSSLIYGILAPLQSIHRLSNSFPLYLSLNVWHFSTKNLVYPLATSKQICLGGKPKILVKDSNFSKSSSLIPKV